MNKRIKKERNKLLFIVNLVGVSVVSSGQNVSECENLAKFMSPSRHFHRRITYRDNSYIRHTQHILINGDIGARNVVMRK